jgi:hypothetical protein
MKINYLLMLSFILGLFGCNKAPKETVTEQAYGPFTIRKVIRTGKSFNMNYGMVEGSATAYEVLYNGKAISAGDLEANTGLPGIWRVFHLPDAPGPALILGSQSLVLVTDEGASARVTPLHAQSSEFASVQWLDRFDGQPGVFRQIFSSDEVDTSAELSGGRFLAINGALVLDTRTLDILPFRDRSNVDGYVPTGGEILAVSPDTGQVVMMATPGYSAKDTPEEQALICFPLRGGQPYAVPFSMTATRLGGLSEATTEWVLDHFAWSDDPSTGWRLGQRSFDSPPPRKGRLQYTRHQGYTYTLDGVTGEMVAPMVDHIQAVLGLSPDSLRPADHGSIKYVCFSVNGIDYLVDHQVDAGRLEVRANEDRGRIDDRSSPVWTIGSSFNRLLGEGRFQDFFLPEKGDGE